MREIKFRGYNRKNRQWLYGFYLQNRGAHFVCPNEFATGKSWDDYEVEPETIGQFTGLTDKNGREIYEGDNLWVDGAGEFIVWYDKDFCQFHLRKRLDTGGFADKLWSENASRYEVIGPYRPVGKRQPTGVLKQMIDEKKENGR